MTFEKFVRKYDGKIIEDDGCVMSTDAIQFVTAFRAMLKSGLPDCILHVRAGHYYLSGFVIAPSGKITYIYYSIQRGDFPLDFSRKDPMSAILYREAESEQDFHGGQNHFCSVLNISELYQFVLR